MSDDLTSKSFFHLHLVSDSTGETLNAVAKAAVAQFEMVHPIEHIYALVRGPRQLDRVLRQIEASPGIVMFTMVSDKLRRELETRCRELQVPCIAVLDPVMQVLGAYLGTERTEKPGSQHTLDAEYFARIDALNYTIAHDDGQNLDNLEEADIVLVGVSRTSKTPTCMYLAHRGVKAANYPLVPEIPVPHQIEQLSSPLVVGLIASPERLLQIRKQRLLSLKEDAETNYVDLNQIRAEVTAARRLYARHGWPIIDVSRRSIEETAASILNLYTESKAPAV
ncbi:pyruvate, water dikinase regulatory protein [Pyruvatibacter mobilis]|uniref:pyruvate, water dikinase regulatory protein n=1 Tax=Pyruvatibacter mobilis TaxID=1712261 RepID=UPI003BABDFCC